MHKLFYFIHSYLFVIMQLNHMNDNLRISDHTIVEPFSSC